MDRDRQGGAIEKTLVTVDGRTEEVWALPTGRDYLFELFRHLFDDHWDKLTWGPLIPGAAYELKCPGKPERMTMSSGGYLTVHWGARGHFHLCLGAPEGDNPGLAQRRSPGRLELYRRLDADGDPISWGLRMFNGADESQITIFLPNPFVSPSDRLDEPVDWDRLALWDELFPRLTGHPTDGRDRCGKGYARSSA